MDSQIASRRSMSTANPSTVCAEVRMNSSVWRASRAIPAAGPPPMRNASGRAPARSGPWFTFGEGGRAQGGSCAPARGERGGEETPGSPGGGGREPLDEQELVDAEDLAALDQR